MPLALEAVATGLGCLPVAFRWTLVRRGVVTRVGRVALASVTAVIVVVFLLRHFTRVEGGY